MFKIMFAAAAAVALLAGQAVAADVETSQVQTAVVHTGRVDYASQSDVQRLYRHINAVARRVCSTEAPERIFAPSAPDPECVRNVEAQAVGKINQPLLTAAFDGDKSPVQPRRALAGNDQ